MMSSLTPAVETRPTRAKYNGNGNGNRMHSPIVLTSNARTVLEKRYLRRGPDGKPIENVTEMFERVASTVAQPDEMYGQAVEARTEEFFNLLATLRFFPNSPTFTGAGTPLGQLAACFVLPIRDDMGRDPQGIFSILRAAALIQQTGGGNGFSFSRLRPKGDHVSASAGIATGPLGFLRVYDKAFGEIAQGGTRRGANMAVLRVDHPDIEDFVRCKEVEGEVSNFNISVGITDQFMRAVEKDENFDLVNPRDGRVWKTLRARGLFDEIVRHAHFNGEPGALFLDSANRSNPVPHLYELEATNPCGEQWLGPYENCCLGSVNLAQHLNADDKLDWGTLRDTVVSATRFLDNVVDANKYVPAVPELVQAAKQCRRIGLGIMGLGDVLYRLRVRYGSAEGQELAAQIMEYIRYHAMSTGIDLARERGPFGAIKGSIYDPENLRWSPPEPMTPYKLDFGRPGLDWGQVAAGIKAHGIRNAAQTTIAPTGTIATVAGVESYGCEPVFALAYTRHVNDNGNDLQLNYVSPLFEGALTDAGVDEGQRREIIDRVLLTGSCQEMEEVPASIRDTFVVTSDITPLEHVRMQAAMQAFVDNSLSKTINFPVTATIDEVKSAYMTAWTLGCKGITVYVAGTRETVVLETKETALRKRDKPEQMELPQLEQIQKKPRPRALHGATYEIATPLGKAFVTVNRNGDDQPFEVFCNVGKAGSDTAAVSEAIGRLVSLCLRLPSAMTPVERLEQVIDQLGGIGGGRPMGFGPQRVRSLPDGIARALAEDLGRIPKVHDGPIELKGTPLFKVGDLCPSCGQATFVAEEGCRRCHSCGHSEC
jgi:ribonucleoside-diphosphate reductase alpha chain